MTTVALVTVTDVWSKHILRLFSIDNSCVAGSKF